MKNFSSHKLHLHFSIIAFSMLLVSCINLKNTTLVQDKSITDLSEEIKNERSAEYKINSGDHLYLKIYSTDPTTSKLFQTDFPELMNPSYIYLNSYKVDNDGFISYSFVDKIEVKGLTLIEARDKIQKELSQYFKDINVFVKLVNFSITIIGEVKNPGTFTIDKEEINILQAIGKAGGITEFGNVKQIKLIRKSPNGSYIHMIDLTDNGILQSKNYFLLPDDIIYVETRGAKNFAFNKFPYTMIFSILGLGLAAYNLTK